jgi:hypothetical protein
MTRFAHCTDPIESGVRSGLSRAHFPSKSDRRDFPGVDCRKGGMAGRPGVDSGFWETPGCTPRGLRQWQAGSGDGGEGRCLLRPAGSCHDLWPVARAATVPADQGAAVVRPTTADSIVDSGSRQRPAASAAVMRNPIPLGRPCDPAGCCPTLTWVRTPDSGQPGGGFGRKPSEILGGLDPPPDSW